MGQEHLDFSTTFGSSISHLALALGMRHMELPLSQTARGHGRQGRVQPISQRPVRSQGDVGALLATPTPLVTFGCLAARVWIRQARLVSSMISGHTTPPPQHGLWYPAPRRPTRTALMGPKVQA